MLERRTCERFVIPGATVSYKVHGFFKSHQPFPSDLYPIADLCKGGLCFMTDTPLKENKEVSLLIRVSEKENPISLEGKIMYVSLNTSISYRYRVGVQFKPFGTNEGFNALESLNRLDELEKTYCAGKNK